MFWCDRKVRRHSSITYTNAHIIFEHVLHEFRGVEIMLKFIGVRIMCFAAKTRFQGHMRPKCTF